MVIFTTNIQEQLQQPLTQQNHPGMKVDLSALILSLEQRNSIFLQSSQSLCEQPKNL
jgi:hypothetical protein